MFKRKLNFVLLIILCSSLFAPNLAMAEKTYILGTGGPNGLYYPVGKTICQILKKTNKNCSMEVQSSSGSVENIKGLMNKNMDFAMGQADIAKLARQGKLPFQNGKPYKNLRAVCSLYTETLTLVTQKDSGITEVFHLKGKKVAVGEKGSGTLQNSKLALHAGGLTLKDLGKAYMCDNKKAVEMYKAGKLDAIFFTVGHPNKLIKDLSLNRKNKIYLVPIPNVMNKILIKHDHFVLHWISVVHYRNAHNKVGVETFGVRALLLVNKDTPDKAVKTLVNTLLNNVNKLKKCQTALILLAPAKMVKGVTVPFHKAAKKIYQAKGLMN